MKKAYYLGLLLLVLLMGIFLFYNLAVGAGHRMRVIIDRFEGEFAVVELPDKTTVDMNIKLLEPDSKEGDIIEIKSLRQETENRKKEVQDLMKDLFE